MHTRRVVQFARSDTCKGCDLTAPQRKPPFYLLLNLLLPVP